MPAGQEFRIYISSTIDDLKAERAAAVEVAGRYGVLVDSYRLTEEAHTTKCVADVRSAHLYIGILGRRYGWIAEQGPPPKSITELEFEACEMPEQPRIPRLMLLRTTTADKDDDSRDGKFAPAERECRRVAVDAFRSRAAATGIEFADIADLKLRLQEAVRTQRDRHYRAAAPEPGMMEQRRQWQTRLKQVALLALQGADDALHQRLALGRAKDFEATPLRINDAALGRQAEQGLRVAQLGALLLTPAALAMLDSPERRRAVGRLLATLRRRFGVAPVLCLQGAEAQLPGEWPAVDVLPVDQAQLLADAAACATDVLARLRVLAPVSAQTRLAVPTLVLAPTEAEARALIDDPAGAFASIADPDTRSQRRKQFDALVKALRRSHPNWPDGFYAATREQWRCFGPGSQSAGELINGALHAINSALPGSREREVLQDAELVRRSYELDEYLLDDSGGSRAVLTEACDRGALVLVDELVLLHPALRESAQQLLAAERGAVATVSACDPAHLPTHKLFGELSFLRVAAVLERFARRRDLQCELALNCSTRVERWLRGAVPRLVADLGGLTGEPSLVERVDDLLQ